MAVLSSVARHPAPGRPPRGQRTRMTGTRCRRKTRQHLNE